VESKLEKLVQQFEKKHNKPFLYNGAPLMEVIAEKWENRRLEKENEKEIRVSIPLWWYHFTYNFLMRLITCLRRNIKTKLAARPRCALVVSCLVVRCPVIENELVDL
jgi:hypothetical protein